MECRADIHAVFICVSVCVWSHIPQKTQQCLSDILSLCLYMYRITALLALQCSYIHVAFHLEASENPFSFFFFLYQSGTSNLIVNFMFSCLILSSRLSLNLPNMPQCFMPHTEVLCCATFSVDTKTK